MKPKAKLDSISSQEQLSYQARLRVRLSLLRRQVLAQPKIIAHKSLLSESRRVLFALGLGRTTNAVSQMAVFGMAGFLILGLIASASFVEVTHSFGKQVLGTATTGFQFLEHKDFSAAAASFAEIRNQIHNSSDLVIRIIDASPLGENVEQLLTATDLLLVALNRLTLGLREFEDVRIFWNKETNTSDFAFYAKLQSSRDHFIHSAKSLREAETLMASVNAGLLPSQYRANFSATRQHLATAREVMEEAVAFETFALGLLSGEKKTYVLIFQNNNEARAIGGFIGTYGILEFQNGQMALRKIETIYQIDGQLREPIAAPGPLQRQVSDLWAMRDSNWFVDFPSSSRKILEFFEKETGILAEGVISFTPDVFERLLTLTGPIGMPEYGEVLTAENFRDIVQYKTSIDYDQQLNQPKKFLADFAPRLLDKLSTLETGQALTVYQILSEMIAQKHLMMFSLAPEVQGQIREWRLSGEIKQTSGDYLGIFHSNVGGGKTDQSILQQVRQEVKIVPRGKIQVRLQVTRVHQGFAEKYFPRNIDFMRILTPRGSQLIAASGFDDFALKSAQVSGAAIDSDLAFWDSQMIRDERKRMYIGEEAGYEVFANWLELDPGQTKTVELVYELPVTGEENYSLVLQKQPGARPFDFTLEVQGVGAASYYYPPTLQTDGATLRISEEVNSDKFFGVIWQ